MNLDELRSAQNTERQKDTLQHLRESFYEDVSAYVSDLEGRRDRAAEEAEDPFASPEVRRLTDEIETAKDVTRAIYERRLGKLVKRATLAAADMPVDDEGLTAEERELFSDLVDRIERNKSHVLDVVESDPADVTAGDESASPDETASQGETGAATPDETAIPAQADPDHADPDRPDPDLVRAEAAEVAGTDQPPADDPGAGETVRGGEESPGDFSEDPEAEGLDGRTTVRITRDVGEIFGVDQREYDLTPETVVTLPEANADPLLDRGAAERIE